MRQMGKTILLAVVLLVSLMLCSTCAFPVANENAQSSDVEEDGEGSTVRTFSMTYNIERIDSIVLLPDEFQRKLGEARIATPRTPVLRVGDHVLTADEFAERMLEAARHVEFLIALSETDDPGIRLMVGGPGFQKMIQLMRATDPESIALARMIEQSANYQQAIGEGFSPEDSEMWQAVEHWRENVRFLGGLPYIETVGADTYWRELAPQQIRRAETLDNQRMALLFAEVTGKKASLTWDKSWRTAVERSDIELLDAATVSPATVESALQYLDSLWKLLRDIDSSTNAG